MRPAALCLPGWRGGAGCSLLCRAEPSLFSWPLLGNLDLLPSSGKSTKPGATPTEHKGLVSHNGSLINVGNLLQRAEQQDSGRLYLENKIHTLELKLGEWPVATGTQPRGDSQIRVSGDQEGSCCSHFRPLALGCGA